MIFLSAGLPNLQFNPGLPIPGAETIRSSFPAGETGSNVKSISFPILLQAGLAMGFVLMLFVIIISLVRKASIKRIGQLAAGLVILSVLMILLRRIELPTPVSSPGDRHEVQSPTSFVYEIAPIGDPPAILFKFVIISLLLGVAILGIWLLYKSLRQSRSIEDPLAREAVAALQAIEDGQDLRNVIINCYLQMVRVVKEGQGIEREDSVTPREFEDLLTTRGVPAGPIHQITRLFEKVRYGSKAPDRQDKLEAIECLSAIRISCQPGEQRIR